MSLHRSKVWASYEASLLKREEIQFIETLAFKSAVWTSINYHTDVESLVDCTIDRCSPLTSVVHREIPGLLRWEHFSSRAS